MLKNAKLLSALIALPLVIQPVYAEEVKSAEIPVSVEGTDTAKVTISSDSAEAMSAVVGETTIDVKEGENCAFQVNYDEPVSYTYTLTQVAGSESDVTYDTNEYQAHVFVEAEESGELVPHVVVWKVDDTAKSDGVHFTNVKKSEATPTPDATATPEAKKSDKSADTSDNSNTLVYGAGVAVFGLLAIVALVAKRKAEK